MSKIENYSHALDLNKLDKVISNIPEWMKHHEDMSICVSNNIYNNIKSYLIDEKYKGFLIYTIDRAPKDMMYASTSKFHN